MNNKNKSLTKQEHKIFTLSGHIAHVFELGGETFQEYADCFFNREYESIQAFDFIFPKVIASLEQAIQNAHVLRVSVEKYQRLLEQRDNC